MDADKNGKGVMSESQGREQLLMQRTFRLSLDVTIEITDNTDINLQDAAAVTDVQERLWLRHYIQDQKELLDALLANPEMRNLFLKTLVLRKVESIPETRLQKAVLGEALHDEEMLGAILATLPDVVQRSFQNNDKGWSLAGAEQFHESFNTIITGTSLHDITESELADLESTEAEVDDAESAEDEVSENEAEAVPVSAGDEV